MDYESYEPTEEDEYYDQICESQYSLMFSEYKDYDQTWRGDICIQSVL